MRQNPRRIDPAARLIDAAALPVYDLGTNHPFARHRHLPLFDLLRRHALFAPADLLPSTVATPADLALAHTPAYIAAVEALSADRPTPAAKAQAWQFGLGSSDNPFGPGLHHSAAAIAGATLACARAVARGEARAAFNPAGGLHHAMADRASGFCVYGDVVVGIREAQRLGCAKVLYVDFDVHAGDGVAAAFAADPSVLTLSFHQDPDTLFPGTGYVHERGVGPGVGTTVNVPLAPYTGDASWLRCVRAVLPAVAAAFRPDLIVSQHGCDPHFSDPLGQLRITTQAMGAAAVLTRELADELCDGRWVATGGGGYQPYSVIPRAWSWVWCVVSGRDVPERLDPAWRAHWGEVSGERLPERWWDGVVRNEAEAQAAAQNERTLQAVLAGGTA